MMLLKLNGFIAVVIYAIAEKLISFDAVTCYGSCVTVQSGLDMTNIGPRPKQKHRPPKHAITISANITLSEENFFHLKNLHHFSIRNITGQVHHEKISAHIHQLIARSKDTISSDRQLKQAAAAVLPKESRYYIYSVRPATDEEKSDNDELIRIRYRKLDDTDQEAVNVTHTDLVRSRRTRTAMNDVVSKNISMVLENLLKSYENSQLPTHGQGIPTLVRTNILIRSMGPISELDMDYAMDCYFRQYWRDKRLSFRSPIKSLSLSIKMLERIWRPDTYFYNGKHSHVHTITVPNKLLRLSQDGDILYSMRLTIKASCPMELKNFPMDRQSCPLILGSYAYTTEQLAYEWQSDDSVSFVPGMTLSQFDLVSFSQRNFTLTRREGDFSVLQVSFNLQRHTGYFLIQIYVPCILIVVLSWVSFWIHREATSDRVGLGITTVLTLSTISLDSRKDLPKVRYATSLDWFLLMCFFYCIATLLEFAFVHYFTKVGSGEIFMNEDEWEDIDEPIEQIGVVATPVIVRSVAGSKHDSPTTVMAARRRSSLICPIYNDPAQMFRPASSCSTTMERTTQTEPPKASRWKHLWLCFLGDEKFRRQRQREATEQAGDKRHVNSVSLVDRSSRVLFPASFLFLNILYWLVYYTFQDDFPIPRFHGI